MQPNVLDCVSDITYKCVYTYDSVSQHSFTVPLLNGVIAGEYEVNMKIVDMTTGQTVYEQPADNVRLISKLMLETSLIGLRLTIVGWMVINTTSVSMLY